MISLQETCKQIISNICLEKAWMVHADWSSYCEKSAIENPNQLDIETRVNGEIRQQSNTEQFIFPVEEIIAILSKGMTLEPGDIIATGTPAGVGKGFKPPKFLQKGDEIAIKVKGVGTLTNTVH